MGVLTVCTEWSPAYGRHVYRAGGPVRAHDFATELVAELSPDPARTAAAVERLRSGSTGPDERFPDWIDGAEDGVQLVHSNGLCMLDHLSFPEDGELVLTSEAMADFIEAMAAMISSPGYGTEGTAFPDIEVEVLGAGPEGWRTYLERGGIMRFTSRSDDGTEHRHTARRVDDQWAWVDDATGAVVRVMGPATDPGAAPEGGEGGETDLEQVVRLLGQVAVGSWDEHPRAADPFGVLDRAAPVYERLPATDREELPGFLSDYERRSLTGAVNGLCGRALTERRPSYLSAAAMCLELGADRHDWRDVMIGLAVMHHSATRLEVGLGGSEGPGRRDRYPRFADRYQAFLQRTDEVGRRLERFGLIETRYQGATVFTPHRPSGGGTLGRRRT